MSVTTVNIGSFVDGIRNGLTAPGFGRTFLILVVGLIVVFGFIACHGLLEDLWDIFDEFLLVILYGIALFTAVFEFGDETAFRHIETFHTILELRDIATAGLFIAAV